jgi:hypothetical protein
MMGITPDKPSNRKTQNHLILEFENFTLNVNATSNIISKNIGISSRNNRIKIKKRVSTV